MTKEELKRYRGMELEMKMIERKMAALRRRAESPGGAAFSHAPGRGGERHGFADCVAELVELQELYDERAHAMTADMLRIVGAIGRVSDPVERVLLELRYVDGLSWLEIMRQIGYEESQTHRIHGRALAHIREVEV